MDRFVSFDTLTFSARLGILMILSASSALAADQNADGDAWLHMNRDTQTGFVRGYTIGLTRGFAQGCDAYRSLVPVETHDIHNDPFAGCLNTSGRCFSQPVDFYVRQVTDFYQSFPSDRAISFEDVLKKLSDGQNMTPRQIHDWFAAQKR
jgi:hypothetical protein